jgi:hypothetical protein
MYITPAWFIKWNILRRSALSMWNWCLTFRRESSKQAYNDKPIIPKNTTLYILAVEVGSLVNVKLVSNVSERVFKTSLHWQTDHPRKHYTVHFRRWSRKSWQCEISVRRFGESSKQVYNDKRIIQKNTTLYIEVGSRLLLCCFRLYSSSIYTFIQKYWTDRINHYFVQTLCLKPDTSWKLWVSSPHGTTAKWRRWYTITLL